MSLTISKRSKTCPRLPYEKIKDEILGTSYVLSLTFIGEKRAYELNKEHRKADYVPNVLSFPLSKEVGEIYITPIVAKKEAKKFDMSTREFIGYLFIHGLLHLKGYPHGATMDKAEDKYMKRFGLK